MDDLGVQYGVLGTPISGKRHILFFLVTFPWTQMCKHASMVNAGEIFGAETLEESLPKDIHHIHASETKLWSIFREIL